MKTILIVDDEFDVTDILRDLLSDEGYRVVTAGNGKEGLALLAEAQPDLVILDLMMPIMAGKEMLEAMQQNDAYRKIPVLVTTAGAEEMTKALPHVNAIFLQKPFHLDDLLKLMRQFLGRSGVV